MKCTPNSRLKYMHEKGWGEYGAIYYREFQPEDLLPYYDIYDNGTTYFYIIQHKKFLWIEWDKIWKMTDDEIKLVEIPVMKDCYRNNKHAKSI